MKKNEYQLLVICVREECNGKKEIIKKGIHAKGNFANDQEALERFWHIAQKDLISFFDRVVCSVLQGSIRVGVFRFPEKRA